MTLKGNKTLVRSLVLGVLALVLSIWISKRLSKPSLAEGPKMSFRETTVPVIVSQWQVHQSEIGTSGRVQAVNKFELFAEVGGVLLNESFRAGTAFKKGQVIVQIDDREFSAQLKAQRSAFLGLLSQVLPDITIDFPSVSSEWSHFASAIDVAKMLPALPAIQDQKLKSFLSGRNVLNQYYTLKAQELRLMKHQIIAPYSGVLSEVNIQPGSLVRVGQRMGLYLDPTQYELEAAVSPSDLQDFQVGKNLELISDGNVKASAQVSRINASIDPQTQLIKVYLAVRGKEVREGQFFRFMAQGRTVTKSMKIPRLWLTERNTLFAVRPSDSTMYEVPVRVASIDKDQVIVTDFQEGLWWVQRSVAGAFEGMKVVPQLPKKG
jgi:membrane fusion protein, multidrug efflux system